MNAGENGERLNALLATAGMEPLDPGTTSKFEIYLSLYLRWNGRLNLSAIRDEEGVLSRHFVESIAVARALPQSIQTLLDFGSGAGMPGIPIALCRPEIAVTLAESQTKKAAFLQEAVRTLGISVKVHAARAEALRAVFDCVTLRAVEKMPTAVSQAAHLVAPTGWLALMTTPSELSELEAAAGKDFAVKKILPLPGSTERLLALAHR